MINNLPNIEDPNLKAFSIRIEELEKRLSGMRNGSKRRLTIPAIFGRSGDEDFISDYLAYILDPELNGIGTEPLEALLNLAFENISDIDFGQVTIKREYTFRKKPEYGRIDFLIELGDNGEYGIIGIENKMYSPERENQTEGYFEGLKTDYAGRNLFMLFLSPNGRSPISKEFLPVSYVDLARVLRKIQYPFLDDIHKTVIWEDFLYHLEEYIVMINGNLELSGKARLYLEHHQMMEVLSKAYQEDSQKVYDIVISNIKDHWGDSWHYNFQGRNGFQEINRDTWKLGKFYVFFQYFFSRDNLLTRDFYGFMLGVWPKNEESRYFYEWLRSAKPEIADICKQNDMEFYPSSVSGSGGYIIANKEYQLIINLDDLSNFHKQFMNSLDEFSPFISIIDDAILRYKR